ncbi:hypothetical protein PIB30_055764 [Stylosanthes scabra]|uniref:Uncharacterized protein n=1 Tax=Stylosanthes scabra TaxID=79078 RepID=A0ABU6WLY7_9FABA|nr:hypothetical protein [Stylosanthes scabra]
MFQIAFYHRYQLDMQPILPEICCKEVEEWKIEWEEMKGRLMLQPQIELETTKPQPEQEIAATSIEIQEEKELEENPDSDATSKSTTNSTTDNKFTVHKSATAEYEVDEECAKLEENLYLQLEHSDLEMNLATEENAAIDAVEKEEGDGTVSEGDDS